MDAYAEFSGIQIVTFCCMTNHVHIVARVPKRPSWANLPTDEELVRLVSLLNNKGEAKDLETMLKQLRAGGSNARAQKIRRRYFKRMWAVSCKGSNSASPAGIIGFTIAAAPSARAGAFWLKSSGPLWLPWRRTLI